MTDEQLNKLIEAIKESDEVKLARIASRERIAQTLIDAGLNPGHCMPPEEHTQIVINLNKD